MAQAPLQTGPSFEHFRIENIYSRGSRCLLWACPHHAILSRLRTGGAACTRSRWPVPRQYHHSPKVSCTQKPIVINKIFVSKFCRIRLAFFRLCLPSGIHGWDKTEEAPLTLADLEHGFLLGNAVRGLVPARLIGS